jgi:histidinol phosphatase-like PHP family hydrolase
MWSDANLIQLSLKKSIHYLAFTDHCRENADKFSQIATAKHVAERIVIRSLKRRETE